MNYIPQGGHDWKSVELQKLLTFPVRAYRKENGFLGMVSYNPYTDDLLIGSKSSLNGGFANLVKHHLYNTLDNNELKIVQLKEFIKSNNITMVFEVIDIENDPHIIKYDKSHIVLLEIIKNQFEYDKWDYNKLLEVGKKFNIEVKKLDYVFNSWEELYDFKHQKDENYDDRIEGWVFEDVNDFKVKYKTRFYKFWKYMRGVKQSIQAKHVVKKTFKTKEEVMAYNILKRYTPEQLTDMSIIDIEDIFYQEYQKEG